jgi:WD40 repeat protein
VRLWDWVNKRDLAVLDEPEEPREAVFAPDGSCLLTAGRWSARLYRWPSRTEKVTLPKFLLGAYLPAAFSGEGGRLAVIGEDRRLHVLDAATGRTLWKPELPGAARLEYGHAVALSSEGLMAAALAGTQQIHIWDERDRKLVATLGTNQPGTVGAMKFMPDGRHLIAVNEETHRVPRGKRVKAWHLSRSVSDSAERGLQVRLVLAEHIGAVLNDLAVSPDNRHFVVGASLSNDPNSTEAEIRVWDLDEGPPRVVSTNVCFTFTPDGKELLTVGRGLEIVAVDVATASNSAPPVPVVLPNSPPELFPLTRYVALSPNGTRLAVSAADGRHVDIWDWPNRRYLYSLPEPDGAVIRPLIWSPDSRRMVVGNEFGGAALWNVQEVEQALAKLGLGISPL